MTIDEIIDFVAFDKLDKDSLALASKVMTHARNCDECMKKMEIFRRAYDERGGAIEKEELREAEPETTFEKEHHRLGDPEEFGH